MTVLPEHRDFDRDRWERPLIIPTAGGKAVPYKRCTKYVSVLEDRYNLELWLQRMTATGIAERDDLRLAVLAHAEDKGRLNKIVEQAKEAAKASSAATTGTAYHALTDVIDRGDDLPPGLPQEAIASLEAYREATVDLKPVHIEHPVVQDKLGVAGTPDRVVEYQGERYIADTKTGSITFGTLKIAMQLAVYAHSALYDVATGERSHHGASCNRGIVYHVPAGKGTAELRWIDLEAGWAAVHVARSVWDLRLCPNCHQRRRSTCTHLYEHLTEPFGPPARPSLHRQKRGQSRAEAAAVNEAEQVKRMIAAADDPDLIRQLWEPSWPEELVEYARARVQHLQDAS